MKRFGFLLSITAMLAIVTVGYSDTHVIKKEAYQEASLQVMTEMSDAIKIPAVKTVDFEASDILEVISPEETPKIPTASPLAGRPVKEIAESIRGPTDRFQMSEDNYSSLGN